MKSKVSCVMAIFVFGFATVFSSHSFAEAEMTPPKNPSAKQPDGEGIQKVIRGSEKDVQACYTTALKGNAKLKEKGDGKIVVKFEIDGYGSVEKAEIKSSTLNEKVVEDCLVSVVKKMKFAAPPEHKTVTVTYPFLFANK